MSEEELEELEVLALVEHAIKIAKQSGSRALRDVKLVTGTTDDGTMVTSLLVDDKPFEIKVERVK